MPLSFAQQRLWFLAQMEGISEAYHIPVGLRLSGTLDTEALQRALDQIVLRHESLRTRFVVVGGEPVQQIDPATPFDLKIHDLSDASDAESELQQIAQEEAGGSFSLSSGPLIRGRLIRLAPTEHVLLVTMHHIISDGWSIGVLVKDFSRLYSLYRAGEVDPLPELSIQYGDYAVWQHRWLGGDRREAQGAYWETTLSGAPALLELPIDYPRPAQQSYAGGRVSLELDRDLTERLKALSQRHGTTLFMTVLSGFAVLLSRLSGEQDVVIGTPVANRTQRETEELIGFFVNMLALRVDFTGQPTVSELLKRVRQTSIGAQAHQELPFEQVVERLKPSRSLAHSPIFQVMFAWQNNEVSDLDLPGLRLSGLESESSVAKFDLTLDLSETDAGIVGSLEYATSLFRSETVERYGQYLVRLLEAMTRGEDERVSQLSMLPAEEREQLLVEWNATEVAYPSESTVHGLFEAQVEGSPESTALVFEEERVSYGELNCRANRLAHELLELGVRPDDRVAICVERSVAMVVALLGVLKAGGAYVPLDPAYPVDRLSYMLADSGPVAVLTHGAARETLEQALGELEIPVLDLDLEASWHNRPETNPDAQALGLRSSHLAYVIYTSGSTGQPKGVMNEHRGVVNRLDWTQRAYELNETDAVLQKTSFSFDVSVWEFFWPLLYGARLVMARPEGHKDVGYLIEILQSQHITTMHFVPSMLRVFVDQSDVSACTGLRRVLCSGEALPASLAQQFRAQWPTVELHNLYGPTEAAIDVTAWPCPERPEIVPIGRPISNTRIYLLDEYGEPVPVGVAGELYIGGAGVGRGYLNRAELTAERFIASPFVAGDRLYKTGDLARYLSDGNIEYLGRNDFQVKIRGFRIELGEIESLLCQHAGVGEAVVVARGEAEEKRLVAYYTAAVGAAVEVELLRGHLSATLPGYMVPSAYVRMESFPLSPNGKLDRKALPAPDDEAYVRRGYEAPVGEMEETVARVFAEVLGVERVGRNDSFFELGGHSLMAVRLLSRLREAGWQTEVSTLFAQPTVAGLAGSLSQHIVFVVPANGIPEGCTKIEPAMLPLVELEPVEIARITQAIPGGAGNIQDIYPLSPGQEGVLYHHLASREGDIYLLNMLLSLDRREEVDRFVGALEQVIARHDVLRTAVLWEGLRSPVQVVCRAAVLVVEEVALSIEDGDIADQLKTLYSPRRYRLDVRQAPLLRVFMARDESQDRWVIQLLHHHLAVDHVGVEIILRELEACLLGQAAELAPAAPYRDYIAHARLRGSEAEHEAYFRAMLGEVGEPTLPYGLADVQDAGTQEEAIRVVTPELSTRLRRQARQLGVSSASLFHLAFAHVLGRLSSRNDVVFGTVLLGRLQGGEHSAQALGMLINTLPLRVSLVGSDLRQQVLQTHGLLSSLVAHEHASLALAQRCSGIQAPLPLFSAILNYRHTAEGEQENGPAALPGLRVLQAQERTNYPVALSVDDLGEGFRLVAQVTSLVGEDGGRRLCDYMDRVLSQLADALEQPGAVGREALSMLPVSEREQLLVEWNATEVAYPLESTIHGLFEAQVEGGPESTALVYEEERVSYGELNRRANRLAHELVELGVRPDDRVAICVERSVAMVVALLGVLKAGGAYVPLDPAYPVDRLSYMLADSGPVAVLTHGAARETLEQALGELEVPVLDLDLEASWRSRPETNPDAQALGLRSSHLAYVIYTSGSTGTPKGVMVEHRNVVNYLFWAAKAYDFRSGNIAPVNTSFAFDATVTSLLTPLITGGEVRLLPHGEAELPSLSALLDHSEEISLVKLTPTHLDVLRQIRPVAMRGRLSGVFVIGGEALSASGVADWRNAAKIRLINEYGPTEATVGMVVYEVSEETRRNGSVPIGRPISNTRIYLLDEYGEPVPVGVAGELYIGGAGVGRGYLNRAELTAERFIASPFVAGDRLYKTGDLARYLSDGNIEYLGRNDFQVKIRGFRIELGEIESLLCQHAGVGEAVVVARGEAEEKRLVAYYTAAVGAAVEVELLRGHLSATLPGYMVPSAYVRMESFPLSPNGKLDRKALPAPDDEAYVRRGYEAPVGEMEETVARVFAEVLGVERVGRNDSFFELGGHSLMAVRLLSRLREAGWQTEVSTLFAQPTVAGLAGSLSQHIVFVVPANGIPEGCTKIEPAMLPLVELEPVEIARITQAIPGGAGNIQDIYPLSPGQEGVLYHHLASREGDIYLLNMLLSLDRREEVDRFVGALEQVIARHDVLRTAVLWEGLRSPVQVVCRAAVLVVEEVALSIEDGDIADQLKTLYSPRRYRLDVRQAPLLRVFMARDESQDRWVIQLLHHHLAVDHVGVEIILRELEACLLGQAAELAPAAPYRDYIAHARLRGSEAEHEAYFRAMLGEVGEPTLPYGLADVQDAGTQEEAIRVVTPELSTRLRRQARQLGVSSASLFHLAFAHVLGRLSSRNDVVFGTVLLGRLQGGEHSAQALGMLINTLPLRVSLVGSDLRQQVLQTHGLLSSLVAHEHASLALAQRCSGIQAPLPLFSAILNYRHTAEGEQENGPAALPGLRVLQAQERTNYPVALSVDDLGEGFRLVAQVTSLVGEDGGRRLCDYMDRVLSQLADALEQPGAVGREALSMLPVSEREQLLVEWNATEVAYPLESTIHGLFEAQVEGGPESTALVYEEERVSYGELNRRANRLAHELVELGVRPDDRVAICVERSVAMVVALLGVLKAGGAYVPLDPAYPVDRLSYMLADSGPVAVLTHGAARETLEQALGKLEVPVLDLDLEASWRSRPETNPDAQALGLRSSHLAYVIYTSGSTGQPKGVMIEHRGICNLVGAQAQSLSIARTSRVLQFASFSFDASVYEMVLALCHGACLCIPADKISLLGASIQRTIAQLGITHAVLTPAALANIESDEALLTTLAVLILAGELPGANLIKKWSSARRVFNAYGPTETSIWATLMECRHGSDQAPPIGRPIANTRIYLLDEYGEPVPTGVAGELYIGGAGVARGYLNRAELTVERFNPSTFVAGDRLYKTGDLGRYLPDGNIEYLGRNDFQVKIRGFRIELGEIESLLGKHASVAEAIVLARSDKAGDKRLVAYYKAAGGDAPEVDAEFLRAHLSATLPAHMVPSAYVRIESFPLSPNGKLDRKALPAPDDEAYVRRGYEAPAGKVEEIVAGVFAEVLGVDRVGRNDNFFELGGHSLLAVRVMSRLRDMLGQEISLDELFSGPSVLEVAACAQSSPTALPRIERAERNGFLPLSFAQQRLWFLAQMEGISEAYHIPVGLRLSGTLDTEALQRALDQIVLRHESLRTRFVVVGGEPVQQIDPATPFDLKIHDLSDASDAESELQQIAQEEAGGSFSLSSGPLIRGRLIRLAPTEHVLLVTMHHIISDGWSIGVLVKDFSRLYGLYRAGEVDPLPELSIQYGDYAVWQHRWLGGDRREAQGAYWETTLSGAPALLELPIDYPRPAQQRYEGQQVRLSFDATLTGELKALSQRHGTTLFMTVLAAWATVLSRLSGQQDIVIGTPVANRTQRETEELIGYFVNMLSLRVDLSGQPTVSELLRRVRQTAIGAQAHQELPFEQVVERIKPSRSQAHSPIFQVMFAWQSNEAMTLALPELNITSLTTERTMARFDLTLDMLETPNGVEGILEYSTALFKEATVQRYVSYLKRLLHEMVAYEAQPVHTLSMLPVSEREQLLVEWNATEVAYPLESTIHGLFEAQVEGSPESTALVFEEERVSYGELNCRANRLAHELVALGVRPDDRVAICVERSVAMVVALLGVLKAGGAYVPLDPAYPVDRLSYMLADSGPVAVLTHGAARETLEQALGKLEVPVLDLDLEASWHSRPETNPDANALGLRSSHLAYVIYTSGSTGQPKGVAGTVSGLANRLMWFGGIVKHERPVTAIKTSISFIDSITEILGALLGKGKAIIFSSDRLKNVQWLAEGLALWQVTNLTIVPSHLKSLLDIRPDALGSVRNLICSGEQLTPDVVRLVKTNSPDTRVFNFYGSSEVNGDATFFAFDEEEGLNGDRSVIGRPISNMQIYILDLNRQPVPVGVTGELYLSGAGLARGYINQVERTAERFLSNPFVNDPDTRMYKTGDIGRWLADGRVEYLGRLDSQVKIRGFRVELEEVEARLRAYPDVRDAAVTVNEDETGEKRLVTYYTLVDTTVSVGVDRLRAHMGATLPDYMVPAAYVRLDNLPLNANGKLDRNSLPVPPADAYAREDYEAPVNDLERRLAELWSEVLDVETIGRNDNFFDLGGHSLLAVRLVSRIRSELAVKLPVRAPFDAPTIAKLAALCLSEATPSAHVIHLAGNRDGRAIFCMPTVGEHINYYSVIARNLGRDFCVFGLQPRPLWWEKSDALQKVSMQYADMIQEQQPNGPYRLFGWSAGGRIALAVAAELERRGQQLCYVGLLDMPLPSMDKVFLSTYWRNVLHTQFSAEVLELISADTLESFLNDPDRLSETQLAELLQVMREGHPDATPASIRLMHEQVKNMEYQHIRITEAKLPALNVPIHACWAKQSDIRNYSTDFDWSVITIQAHKNREDTIDSDHASMMTDPHASDVAALIVRAQKGEIERSS
ncbi:non-ribosomal peptide synthetase [Granulicella mallensis]|uniref:non-ribosomal peptide synthetase n=1 Tax=Granulicella mallensis TaxID=940614 RepID=UPI0021D79DF6|nr:non-ribosomal peptide synthetase [Granulicella mallensis]